jgi:hypothetical protein
LPRSLLAAAEKHPLVQVLQVLQVPQVAQVAQLAQQRQAHPVGHSMAGRG